MPAHRLSGGHRRDAPPPFLSGVPRQHPHRAAIEGRFERLLETLGPSWFLVVEAEAGGNWNVCLTKRRDGHRVLRLWTATLSPTEQNEESLEPWLRALARRVRHELDMHVGLRPATPPCPEVRVRLDRLVLRYHGGYTRDGHVVVAREVRPRFLDEAAALGIRLEIGLWERGRTVFVPTPPRSAK
jgi:hypothetical protein